VIDPTSIPIPGDSVMPIEQLRQAVPGLAGITGLLLFPTIGSWVRLVLDYLERDRPGQLVRPRRISGISIARAIGTTTVFAFFLLTTLRAAGDLRSIQAEAPVATSGLQGAVVGLALWAIYAVGISTLRRDSVRRRHERRMGGLLR
jgi:hypothetical protein